MFVQVKLFLVFQSPHIDRSILQPFHRHIISYRKRAYKVMFLFCPLPVFDEKEIRSWLSDCIDESGLRMYRPERYSYRRKIPKKNLKSTNHSWKLFVLPTSLLSLYIYIYIYIYIYMISISGQVDKSNTYNRFGSNISFFIQGRTSLD